MKINNTLCALVAATIIGTGNTTFTSCDNTAYKERVRQEQINKQINEQKQLEEIYNNSQIIAKYSIPCIEIKTQKISYTLDPLEHIGNAIKAQTIQLPVSEAYFSTVEIGQKLQSKFNAMGMIFDGKFEEYSVSISNKIRNDAFYIRDSIGWREINPTQYNQLITLNNKKEQYKINTKDILLKGEITEEVISEAKKTCNITIESQKSNIKLDIFKHIENNWNKMRYPIEIPKFLGDNLKVGSYIEQDFVGGSLFFSNSPSMVSYKVLSKSCE